MREPRGCPKDMMGIPSVCWYQLRCLLDNYQAHSLAALWVQPGADDQRC